MQAISYTMEENPAYGSVGQNQENMYEIVEVTPRRKKKDQLARDSVKPIGTCPVEQKASSKRTYLFLILMVCGLLFLVVVLQVLTLLLTMMTDDHGMQITANNGSQSQLILYKQIGDLKDMLNASQQGKLT